MISFDMVQVALASPLWILTKASLETLQMVVFSLVLATLLGIPLGLLLYITQPNGLKPNTSFYRILDVLVNIFRSFPFIILIIILMPLSRILIGRSVGTSASIIPLALAAAPFIARLTETALNEVPSGILEAAKSMGSNKRDILFLVLLPEAMPSLISGLNLTMITLIGYSAMAGAIGGGGLGDVAIRFGLQTHDPFLQWSAIILLLVFVSFVQFIGNWLMRRIDHR